jgi:hypothetical protein
VISGLPETKKTKLSQGCGEGAYQQKRKANNPAKFQNKKKRSIFLNKITSQ